MQSNIAHCFNRQYWPLLLSFCSSQPASMPYRPYPFIGIWRIPFLVLGIAFLIHPDRPLSHVFSTLSKRSFDFVKLMPVFYPVFHIAAITADIANHRNFSNHGHGCGVDIVSAGVSARIIRHTHNILWMTFRTTSHIFHCYYLLVI